MGELCLGFGCAGSVTFLARYHFSLSFLLKPLEMELKPTSVKTFPDFPTLISLTIFSTLLKA